MQLNEKLLDNIAEKELGKLLLFMIKEKIPWKDFFEESKDSIIFKTSLKDKIHSIVETLLQDNVIEASYPEGIYRLELVKPLYINNEVTDEQFNMIRDLWSNSNTGKVGWMGDLSTCKVIFDKWRQENPSYTYQEIYEASKYYIDNTDMIHKFHNFIYKEGEGSLLTSVLEEMKNKSYVRSTSSLI